MITKKDASFLITEMKKVFITREEFSMEMNKFSEKIVKDVADMLQTSVINLLSEHEKRLDRLEKTAGGFPPITS